MSGINDLVTAVKNAVVEIAGLAKAVKGSLPNLIGGVSTTATGGGISPPANVVGYAEITIAGVAYKIPLYKP